MKRAVLPLIVVLCLAGALMLSSAAIASASMHSASFSIPWSAVSSGGERMASAHLQMQGTVALGAILQAHSSQFELRSGYWPGTLNPPEPGQPTWTIYLPLILNGP